jgi:hypothetical protein
MKSADRVTITGPGLPETDITSTVNALNFMPAVIKEARGQIDNLLDTHKENLLKAYRSNEYDLKIGLTISVKGNITKAAVGTDISYVVEKVKDGLSEMINTSQTSIFDVDPEDAQ